MSKSVLVKKKAVINISVSLTVFLILLFATPPDTTDLYFYLNLNLNSNEDLYRLLTLRPDNLFYILHRSLSLVVNPQSFIAILMAVSSFFYLKAFSKLSNNSQLIFFKKNSILFGVLSVPLIGLISGIRSFLSLTFFLVFYQSIKQINDRKYWVPALISGFFHASVAPFLFIFTYRRINKFLYFSGISILVLIIITIFNEQFEFLFTKLNNYSESENDIIKKATETNEGSLSIILQNLWLGILLFNPTLLLKRKELSIILWLSIFLIPFPDIFIRSLYFTKPLILLNLEISKKLEIYLLLPLLLISLIVQIIIYRSIIF
jgi:hypothetical protein